jgi:transcription-repair coupling factor (superfamily II helicase)
MSDLLDEAVAKVRRLPQHRQREAAEILLSMAEHDPADYQLSDEQRAEVRRRLAEPPDYASEAEVEETFNRLTR